DEMTERAYPTYAGGSAMARANRDRLRRHMEAEGFAVYEFEWWHFDYRDWPSYPIGNLRFEDLRTSD
uniref:M15 family metallopeptidase n=1 Tax=Salmonella enterica TaxID=28901 RepID=UPI003297C9EA